MDIQNNKYFKILRIGRISFYVLFFLFFIITPTSKFTSSSLCFYYNKYNIICPTCGVTRAFSSLMHLNFSDAFMYNPVFTVAFGPICIFLFLEDLINIIINIFHKNKRLSIMEYILVRYL